MPDLPGPERERLLRTRTALLTLLEGLARAHRAHGDLAWSADDLAATVRRWIEAQTFAPRTGDAGVHMVDATAARFGVYDDVHLVGLVDGEWPGRRRAGTSSTRRCCCSRSAGRPMPRGSSAARAAFLDLLRLARQRTTVSAFQLEDDSLTGPSVLLDDLAKSGLQPLTRADDRTPIFATEALLARPTVAGVRCPRRAGDWLQLRLARTDAADAAFHGTALAHAPRTHSVGAIELYTQCPFKYFARHVLRLEEETDEEEGLTPRERGIFIHEVFEAFFDRWGSGGRRRNHGRRPAAGARPARGGHDASSRARSTARTRHSSARGSSARRLRRDSPTWSCGWRPNAACRCSAAGSRSGSTRVFELEGPGGARTLPIRGVVDRIDLLADGTLRVIDYKSSLPPARHAARDLRRDRGAASRRPSRTAVDGRRSRVHRVQRLACEVDWPERGGARAGAQRGAGAIHRRGPTGSRPGRFRRARVQPHLCNSCAYAGVCRKDYAAPLEDVDTTPAV